MKLLPIAAVSVSVLLALAGPLCAIEDPPAGFGLFAARENGQDPDTSTLPGTGDRPSDPRNSGIFLFLAGFAAAFTVLHFCLFLFLPTSRSHLYYAILTALQTGFILSLTKVNLPAEAAVADLRLRWLWTFGISMCLVAIVFEGSAFGRTSSLSLKVLTPAGLILLAHGWLRPTSASVELMNLFAFVLSAEMLRLVVVALLSRRRDAWMIGVGFAALTLTGLYLTAGNLGWISSYNPYAFPIGVFGLVVSMSAFLSRQVARTQHELEHQLTEVRRLDARALEQERAAQEARLAHQLLEVESQRQAAELEEARRLQLSMLPERPPRAEGVEIAFKMWTASQVGGDYYDYKEDSGSLTLAIGDATGHGLNSGLMVASTKSLFQSGTEDEALAETLGRISRGIRGMRLRRMNFAMLLARVEGREIRLASAGMPPALLYRAGDGEVEELLLPGPPLGVMPGFVHREHRFPFDPGDTLLFMSDGLPELVNCDGDLLGYERSLELFRDVASKKPSEILNHLFEAASDFADGHPQEDDLTLVVLRAVGAQGQEARAAAEPGGFSGRLFSEKSPEADPASVNPWERHVDRRKS